MMATSTVPALYMFPPSYYSQKARLALRMKAIKHTETSINIAKGEQNSVWYLKLHPNGKVPLLGIGDQYFAESEQIIDIIDQLPSDSGVKLVPAESTPEGKDVAGLREKLNKLDVDSITYGILFNPDLSIDGLQIPKKFRISEEAMKSSFRSSIKKFEQMQRDHPELTEACKGKIQTSRQRIETFGNRETCVQTMDELEKLLDEVEDQLQKTKSSQWLCGSTFTVADINLCVLMGRLIFLGILSRYLTSKRPGLSAYWSMAKEQPIIKTITLENMREVMIMFIKKALKKVILFTAGAGLISYGAWMIYKRVIGN